MDTFKPLQYYALKKIYFKIIYSTMQNLLNTLYTNIILKYEILYVKYKKQIAKKKITLQS